MSQVVPLPPGLEVKPLARGATLSCAARPVASSGIRDPIGRPLRGRATKALLWPCPASAVRPLRSRAKAISTRSCPSIPKKGLWCFSWS